VLRQEIVAIGPELLLVGIDDTAGSYIDGPSLSNEDAVLPTAQPRPVTLLLKHQPRVRPGSLGRFDLQISGHTHGGQLFPFWILTSSVYQYWRGFHELDKGSSLSVSNGGGTWGPPIRLLAPPDVTVITLTTK
jgi:predicted MPP superfamily phosphohydrolase